MNTAAKMSVSPKLEHGQTHEHLDKHATSATANTDRNTNIRSVGNTDMSTTRTPHKGT